MKLPVLEIVPALHQALSAHGAAVVVAPPGSGKTTALPLWLLESGLVPEGQIVMLEPRRVAARSVAAYLAQQVGEPLGERVGYQVRLDSRVSARTRLRVVTEGVLTAQMQAEPDLPGVAAVILDEFHERSVHADMALALIKEVREALREDLLVLVMSATLDGAQVADYLGGVPVLEAEGRVFPIKTVFSEQGLMPHMPPWEVEARMTEAVLETLAAVEGDVLGFLPGARVIEGTRRRLEEALAGREIEVAVLYGALAPAEQDRALKPGRRRRVVLATNLAETSLTIPNISAVVDSGLANVMRFDVATGSPRLEMGRISRASADQRRGRAGRLGPGYCLRLWTEVEDGRLSAFEQPEIQRIDPLAVALEVGRWGADPLTFDYFEEPPMRALEAACESLVTLGLMEETRRLTDRGREVAALPLAPRMALFVLWVAEAHPAALGQALRWAVAVEGGKVRGKVPLDGQIALGAEMRMVRRLEERLGWRPGEGRVPLEALLLRAFPDRVAVARGEGRFALVGGRQARLEEAESRAVIALNVDAGRRGEAAFSQIRTYCPIGWEVLEASPWLETKVALHWEAQEGRVVAFQTTSHLGLSLSRRSVPNTEREETSRILVRQAEAALERLFPELPAEEEALLVRLNLLAQFYPDLGLPEGREAWLKRALPLMAEGLSRLEDLSRRPAMSLKASLMAGLPWDVQQQLKERLPERLEVPSGSRVRLKYQWDGPPVLAVRVQELFGWGESPKLMGGRLPVLIHLLSPAGRPLQVTQDLASFWTRTWPQVRAEMRSRYPKHRWPEDPWQAEASRRSLQRRRGG